MGLMRFDYVRSMTFKSTNKFIPDSRWVLGSLLFIVDKFRYLSLQESESQEVVRSSTDRLSLALVRVDLVNEAQLRHKSSELGEAESDPLGDKANHKKISSPPATDPIC
jgi:hypothetical protein